MNVQKIDKKLTFQARLDIGWKKTLSQLKTETRMSFKGLIEDALTNTYMIGKDGKPKKI